MKYCRPIYLAVHRVNPALARRTFEESGVHFLHPIAKRLIAKVCVLRSGGSRADGSVAGSWDRALRGCEEGSAPSCVGFSP